MEQRYEAVMAVIRDGATVTEVAGSSLTHPEVLDSQPE
jgi:hypothetical protein